MSSDVMVSFEWVVSASDCEQARVDLEESGATLDEETTAFTPPAGQEGDYSESAFDPLTIIAGVMGLVLLARQIRSFIRDSRHDGLILDARTEPVSIRPHPSLDRGQLLVLTATGAQYFERDAAPELTAFIAAVKRG